MGTATIIERCDAVGVDLSGQNDYFKPACTLIESPPMSRKSTDWPVAEAKARLSELIDRAAAGPQTITRNGKPAAIVVGIEEWRRKTRRKGSLAEFFQSAPKGVSDLNVSRAKDTPRDIDL
jgi:prevent-host-death family protein